MFSIKSLLNRGGWKYQWRYLRGHTPWETEITPHEVMDFIGDSPPGIGLDIGCGTGIHSLKPVFNGWDVTGFDFASSAIRIAFSKAAEKGLKVDFITADVTRTWPLVYPYDYALDIGCLFELRANDRVLYADNIARLLKPRAW